MSAWPTVGFSPEDNALGIFYEPAEADYLPAELLRGWV
jgi:hypothetical protein